MIRVYHDTPDETLMKLFLGEAWALRYHLLTVLLVGSLGLAGFTVDRLLSDRSQPPTNPLIENLLEAEKPVVPTPSNLRNLNANAKEVTFDTGSTDSRVMLL